MKIGHVDVVDVRWSTVSRISWRVPKDSSGAIYLTTIGPAGVKSAARASSLVLVLVSAIGGAEGWRGSERREISWRWMASDAQEKYEREERRT